MNFKVTTPWDSPTGLPIETREALQAVILAAKEEAYKAGVAAAGKVIQKQNAEHYAVGFNVGAMTELEFCAKWLETHYQEYGYGTGDWLVVEVDAGKRLNEKLVEALRALPLANPID